MAALTMKNGIRSVAAEQDAGHVSGAGLPAVFDAVMLGEHQESKPCSSAHAYMVERGLVDVTTSTRARTPAHGSRVACRGRA